MIELTNMCDQTCRITLIACLPLMTTSFIAKSTIVKNRKTLLEYCRSRHKATTFDGSEMVWWHVFKHESRGIWWIRNGVVTCVQTRITRHLMYPKWCGDMCSNTSHETPTIHILRITYVWVSWLNLISFTGRLLRSWDDGRPGVPAPEPRVGLTESEAHHPPRGRRTVAWDLIQPGRTRWGPLCRRARVGLRHARSCIYAVQSHATMQCRDRQLCSAESSNYAVQGKATMLCRVRQLCSTG